MLQEFRGYCAFYRPRHLFQECCTGFLVNKNIIFIDQSIVDHLIKRKNNILWNVLTPICTDKCNNNRKHNITAYG